MASLAQSFPPLLCQVCVRVHFQNYIWVRQNEYLFLGLSFEVLFLSYLYCPVFYFLANFLFCFHSCHLIIRYVVILLSLLKIFSSRSLVQLATDHQI